MQTTSTDMIAIGCFWQWFEDEISRRSLDFHLRELIQSDLSPGGFEIGIDANSLISWSQALKRNPSNLPIRYNFLSADVKTLILNSCINTIHLPHPSKLLEISRSELSAAIEIIYHETGIVEGTIHPDECSHREFEQLLEIFPRNFRLSIENMDVRKQNFQSLDEIKRLLKTFPELLWTFDVCHWIEGNQDLHCEELIDFLTAENSQLSKFHYSSPTSHATHYRAGDKGDPHLLCANSGIDLSSFISKMNLQIPWVIEGTVPRGRIKAVKQEIRVLREALSKLDQTLAA